LVVIDRCYLYLIDDFILLESNNGESEDGLYQAYAGVKVVDRDNTSGRPDSRILAEYRDINLRILLALSDP